MTLIGVGVCVYVWVGVCVCVYGRFIFEQFDWKGNGSLSHFVIICKNAVIEKYKNIP